MKRYNFIIRKTDEKEIKINAENHLQAMVKLLEKAVLKDKDFFIKGNIKNKKMYIGIKKITDENGVENIKDYDDFYEKNRAFIIKENKLNLEKNENEIKDNLPKEYIEIVCDKCGNCIRIDDKDLSSE